MLRNFVQNVKSTKWVNFYPELSLFKSMTYYNQVRYHQRKVLGWNLVKLHRVRRHCYIPLKNMYMLYLAFTCYSGPVTTALGPVSGKREKTSTNTQKGQQKNSRVP